MNQNIVTGLIGNATLLLSLGLIYDIVFSRRRAPLPIQHQISSGLVIGGIAIVLMLIPVKWESDIIFDTRTILLGLTGLFFGTLPTLLAMAIAGGYRLNLGGGGALMGVATIISSGLIGLAWRHYRVSAARESSLVEMYVFGGAVHAVMILCMFLLPQEIIRRAIGTLALPVIVIYPVATALLGDLLTARQRRHRVDEELAHERALFKAIFNGISDAIVYADVDRNVIAINPGFTSAFGYTIDDLKGKGTAVIYADQEEYEKQGRLRFNLTAAEQTLPYESSYRKKDGAVFPGETLGTVIKTASCNALGYIGVIRDITGRKRSEQALRDSEEQFRGLVEQSIAGIYIIQDGKFAYVNPRFAEIRGYACADEIVGRDALSLVADKDRGAVAESNRRLLAGETRSIPYSFCALCRDGSTIEVGAHAARATYKGRPAIIGLIQDISEKRRAENEIRRYVTELETAFMSTVEVATTLSEMRDPYTAGHERRVGEIAVAIGAELGLDARRQEGLRVAGYLHDVGKITIPSEILAKPGKLSPTEFKLIQGHAQASHEVLKNVRFPWPVAEVALQHHERMDGSGYPQGLKGDAILLESRILAVADVIEAMASHRPYRPSLGMDQALAEIERGRASAYDPVVADACLKLFREKGYAIPA